MVKTAGMFVELDQSRHPEPAQSIADHLSDRPLVDVEGVAAYLRSGHWLVAVMGVQKDVLDSTRGGIIGGSIVTDGEWLWRGDYAYYVRYHNVVVPEDLLTTIRQRNYAVPPVPEPVLVDLSKQASVLAFGER
jgi:hypothetical protein